MKLTVMAGFGLLVFVADAHAYLDPGSGSAILQGILGALAAIAIALKLYWHRFLRLIGLRRPEQRADADPQASEPSERSGR